MARFCFLKRSRAAGNQPGLPLVDVEHAESQVVAGINYRLCLKIGYHKEDDDVDTTEFVRTVVYRNLQKEYSLTSWTEENCGDDGEMAQSHSR